MGWGDAHAAIGDDAAARDRGDGGAGGGPAGGGAAARPATTNRFAAGWGQFSRGVGNAAGALGGQMRKSYVGWQVKRASIIPEVPDIGELEAPCRSQLVGRRWMVMLLLGVMAVSMVVSIITTLTEYETASQTMRRITAVLLMVSILLVFLDWGPLRKMRGKDSLFSSASFFRHSLLRTWGPLFVAAALGSAGWALVDDKEQPWWSVAMLLGAVGIIGYVFLQRRAFDRQEMTTSLVWTDPRNVFLAQLSRAVDLNLDGIMVHGEIPVNIRDMFKHPDVAQLYDEAKGLAANARNPSVPEKKRRESMIDQLANQRVLLDFLLGEEQTQGIDTKLKSYENDPGLENVISQQIREAVGRYVPKSQIASRTEEEKGRAGRAAGDTDEEEKDGLDPKASRHDIPGKQPSEDGGDDKVEAEGVGRGAGEEKGDESDKTPAGSAPSIHAIRAQRMLDERAAYWAGRAAEGVAGAGAGSGTL